MTYIDKPSLAPSLLEQERDLLSRIARGGPLQDVLDDIIHLVEKPSNGEMLASILFVSEDGQRLLDGAAPSLPKDYNAAIHGIAIGQGVGSCGTAAFTKEPVFVADIATDALWREFKTLALSHGLRACWSVPIKDADGHIIGTFANYYKETRAPTERDMEVISMVAHTAAIAIERHRRERERERAEEKRLLLLRELNHRVKNVFALANSLVMMSAKGTTDAGELAKSIQGRLSALGKAHELVQPALTADDRLLLREVTLASVISDVLAPYLDYTRKDRVRLRGPDVAIVAEAVTGMAMIVHELATNAAKYGALSVQAGTVWIDWSIADQTLLLVWREEGGPAVRAPDKTGFGSTLTEKTVRGQFEGRISTDWQAGGVVVTLEIPLTSLQAKH